MMKLLKTLFSVATITSITFFPGSAKADTSDCINQLIPLGISHNQAQQACSSAFQSGINSSSETKELYKLCKAAQRRNRNTLYYSNGKIMTNYAGKKGATWYYSNGKIMTNYAGEKGVVWYYSNGKIMTTRAGEKGVVWYYSNGKIMTTNGNLISKEELLYPCSYIE
ncbi:MAG: hypothetical protein WCO29_24340 [Nostocales cyanobacterium ELA583]